MTWLLKLYPPRWRRRYGRELAELIAARPFSIATAIDLVAGAIDAWIYPQSSTAAPESKGERTMVLTGMKFRCAGSGPDITAVDKRKSVTIMLGAPHGCRSG